MYSPCWVQVLTDIKKDPNFLEGNEAIRMFMLNHLGGWYMTNHGADFHAKVRPLS